MSSPNYSSTYTIEADAGVEVVLTAMPDTDFQFLVNDSPETTVTVGSKTSTSPVSQTVKVQSSVSAYASSIITANYSEISKWNDQDSSTCVMCFNLSSTNGSYWSVMGTESQGDNPTIFKSGDPGSTTTVEVQVPTAENSGTPSPEPVLDPEMVFLVDKKSNTLFFRGNAPLGAQTSGNPTQRIDFEQLQNAMASAYQKATGDSFDWKEYELNVIALLSPQSEAGILHPEIESFGGHADNLSEDWFPAVADSPATITIPNMTSVTGRMCVWNLNPAGTSDGKYVQMGVALATKLNDWFANGIGETSPSNTNRIFYIHCSSGHDRTGMMCTSYVNQKQIGGSGTISSDDFTSNYIYGTTLNKLKYSGGHYAQNCYDVNNQSVENTKRSRCFLISTNYDKTAAWIGDQLVVAAGKPNPNLSLGDDAKQGNSNYPSVASEKALVETTYVWDRS